MRGEARGGTLARVLENAGWLLAGKGVGAVLSLVYLGIATRTLGPAGFGQFVLILGTAQAISSLVSFQTWQAVVRFGMPHLHERREDALARLTGFTLALDFGGAIVGCLIALASIDLVGGWFDWSEAVRGQALAFAFVVLLSVRSTAIGVLRLHDRFGIAATCDAVTPITRMAGALVVLAAGPSVTGFLIAWAVSEIATALAYWWSAARVANGAMGPRHWRALRGVVRDNPGLLKFVGVTNASTTLGGATKQATTLVVGLFAGPVAAGYFRLAHQLGEALARISDMLSRAVYAELTRVRVRAQRAQLAQLFRHSVRLSAIGAIAIVLVLVTIGKPALLAVAGPDYAPAYPLLLLLGGAAALGLGGTSFEPALLATDRAGQALALRIVSSSVLIGTAALLLPTRGATGAAIAMLSAAATTLILFGGAAYRAMHAPESDEEEAAATR